MHGVCKDWLVTDPAVGDPGHAPISSELFKIYKTMKSVGSFNLVMGILLIVSGITTGVLFIAKGARLLKDKSELMF